jgi:hypothetical protein
MIEVHRAGQDTIVIAGRLIDNTRRVEVRAPGAGRRVNVSAIKPAQQTSPASRPRLPEVV